MASMRVVVKFQDETDLPWQDGVEEILARRHPELWRSVTRIHANAKILRNTTNVSANEFQELVRQATRLDPSYRPPNFLSYFVVLPPDEVDAEALAREFRKWPIVERAWVELPLVGAAAPTGTNPELAKQGYLDPPSSSTPYTGGIDAKYAWSQGGDGSRQILISYERAMSGHEDVTFPGPLNGITDPTGPFGPGATDVGHGTAVLGIVAMEDNNKGGTGIAYELDEFQWTSPYDGSAVPDRQDALWAAIKHFTKANAVAWGRVLLFEVAIPSITDASGETYMMMPVEVYDAYYQAIRLATALGIVVVEPAGNRNEYLDDFQDPTTGGARILDPSVRDSGAILVGACNKATRDRWFNNLTGSGTNYGTRVNCFAWGEKVWAPAYNGAFTGYDNFNGTSSAAAIIAGAALVVQTLVENTGAGRLSGLQMRALLSNPATGTKAVDPAPGDPALIGVMPNLKLIIDDAGFGARPDVFLRDNLLDDGAAHNGPISVSPDIIVLPSLGVAQDPPVADGQAAWGQGSGKEGDDAIGFTVTAGIDNFIYARVKNRGPVDATNVVVAIFYAPPATLVTPDMWTPVGTTAAMTVPAGGALTVSPPLRWLKTDVPAIGHYCFVALVGSDGDPQPDPANIPAWLADWDVFFHLIRDNNNITWRNFNVA
jgi:serine protease